MTNVGQELIPEQMYSDHVQKAGRRKRRGLESHSAL